MDIKNLTYFITIAEQKNMRKAAELLYISQPSLSYYLTKLEAELGTPLFYRRKKELELTTAGQMYLEAAISMVRIRNDLYKNIQNMHQRQRLVVANASVWGNNVVSQVLPEMYRRFPELSLEISRVEYHYIKTNPNHQQIDFYLGSFSNPSLLSDTMEVIHEEPLRLAVHKEHPFAQSHSEDTVISFSEILDSFQDDSLILSRPTSANYQILENLFHAYNKNLPEKICDINGLDLTASMIASGNGYGFMPVSGISFREKISYYTIDPSPIRYNVIWHRRDLEHNEVQEAFLNLVKEYFQNPR